MACRARLLDATAAGAPLYAQLGFVDAGRAYLTAGPQPLAPAPLPISIFRLEPGSLAELAAFDAPIFGADRRAVLADLAAAYAGRLLVARDDAGAMSGYVVAQARTIGPWAARTPTIAERLLHAGLACGFATPRVLIPAGNTQAISLLATAGIVVRQEVRHMRRGQTGAPPGDRTALYGLASFALG
jgi:Acetyltransferase (GNAT) domain